MHPRNRWFIVCSLAYAILGGAFGLLQTVAPSLVPGLPARAHAHIMLLGFVTMMIYGVALHVLPRFANRPLHWERLANAQFWVANAGLILIVAGWLAYWKPLLMLGGALAWLAMLAFAYNIIRSVSARPQTDGPQTAGED
jgi:cbb3-type cytochrome oxidase subunit 1